MAKRNYQESKEAQTFIRWCRLYPEIGNYIFHIPNEGQRNYSQAVRLACEGLKAGVPDYFYFVPRGTHHGLFIELKSEKGVISPYQKEFGKMAQSQGYLFKVCRGWVEAASVVREYRSDLSIPPI